VDEADLDVEVADLLEGVEAAGLLEGEEEDEVASEGTNSAVIDKGPPRPCY